MALSVGFEKHAIIGGCVDSFCLVCNSHLRTYDEVIVHIEKPIHKKNLDSAQFNEKYKEDNILKVREGYFCMFCCILLSTIRKVALHVAEPHHISNKGIKLLKRFGAFITAYDEIFITNAAWGGIMDGSCAICDVEVTDKKRHETETVHVLNVIRSEVEFGESRQIYRKVDDNSIYCITCNEMFSNDGSKSHLNELEHNNKLEACKNAYKMHKHEEENNNSIEQLKNPICTLEKDEIQNVDRISTSSSEGFNTHSSYDETVDVSNRRQRYGPISASLDKFEKNGIYIDIQYKNAYCEKCTENVDFNYKAINKHIEKHGKLNKERNDEYVPYLCEADTSFKSRDNPEREENGRPQSAIASQDTDSDSDKQYGPISSSLDKFKKNGIYIDIEYNIAYCEKCTENIDFNCKAINQHIEEHGKSFKERNEGYVPYLCEADTSFKSRDNPEREENGIPQSAIASQDTDSDSDKQYGPISSSLDKFKKNGIYIDIQYNIAYCEKCTENVDFNCKAINKHIEEHGKFYKERNEEYVPYLREADTSFKSRDNPEREENQPQSAIASQDTDSDSNKQSTSALSNDVNHVYVNETVATDNIISEITEDPIIFAKTNMLTYNKDNSNAYCRICEVKLPANIKSMKEHVSGKGHKKNVSNQTPLTNTDEHGSASNTDERFIEKTLTIIFVNEAFSIRTALVTEEIINYKFCLEEHSFNMITRTGVNLRCEVCEEYLTSVNVVDHMYGASHYGAVAITPILTSLHTEFVREVRSGEYHCGFCNLVEESWDNLQLHLACNEHRDAKLNAELRLMLHMPTIRGFNVQFRRRPFTLGFP